ncbi:MAG: Vacuolar protein sorting-associated protein 62 [Cirrosporium novae-zelandiae]|nr:MAG: Vacuolar protein sorting-associated protein 62 [Cirrosporium novae-zelandiae]
MALSFIASVFLVSGAIHSASATPIASSFKAKRSTIPDYALTYAPYSHLWSEEEWWPSDIATHVEHVTPEVDYVAVASSVTLEDLDTFSTDTYLTSNDNVEDNPAWLLSAENEPDDDGYSAAPATIICSDKTDYVDCFYFYFYSYNHGNKFLGTRYGNHVGDWEHTMVRFVDGSPEYIYLSAHDSGTAYTYSALTQTDNRATTYIAGGSHANYVSAGKQDYVAALLGTLSDTTDSGPYWDVTANYRGFWYDADSETFTSAGGADIGATEQTTEGVSWLSWLGHWGDEQYKTSDSRQSCLVGECHYVSGPTGPFNKNLGRTAVCEDEDDCTIESSI